VLANSKNSFRGWSIKRDSLRGLGVVDDQTAEVVGELRYAAPGMQTPAAKDPGGVAAGTTGIEPRRRVGGE